MINSAVVEVFIDYLLDAKPSIQEDYLPTAATIVNLQDAKPSIQEDYLPTAATIVNLQDGISTVSAVVVAYIADSYLNCFTTIVICALINTMVIPHSFLV